MNVNPATITLRDGRTLTSDDPEFRGQLPITSSMITRMQEAADTADMIAAVASAVMLLEARTVGLE